MVFSHYGDLGDAIYSLAAVKYLCDEVSEKAKFYLCFSPGPRELMTPSRAKILLPLLSQQSYLIPAWSPKPLGVRLHTALNKFHKEGWNLADQVNHYLDIENCSRVSPWLRVDNPNRVASVVISRSSRYHADNGFPWAKIIDILGPISVFVGLTSEYEEFTYATGISPNALKFHETENLLQVAEIIAACDIFIGNQSAPRAIAEALKVSVIIEVNVHKNDTHWNRPGAWYGSTSSFWCPALSNPVIGRDLASYKDYTDSE